MFSEFTNLNIMRDKKNKGEKRDKDPDFVYFDRAKSHNTAFYGITQGVCTNTRMELQKIERTTKKSSSSNNLYWSDPRDILRGEDFVENDHIHLDGTEMETSEADMLNLVADKNKKGEEIEKLVETRQMEDIESGEIGQDKERAEVEADLREESEEELVIDKRGRKRKRKFRGSKKSGNMSRYSQRELERQSERQTKQHDEEIRISNLKVTLGNPWDGVSFDDKKKICFALLLQLSPGTICLKECKLSNMGI